MLFRSRSAAIIPGDCLRGALLEAGLPVQLRCAPPHGMAGSRGTASTAATGTAGLCQALGVPPRAALTLIVVAPVVPAATADVAPPARSLDLNMAATAQRAGTTGQQGAAAEQGAAVTPPAGQPLSAQPGQRRRWERARITERPG